MKLSCPTTHLLTFITSGCYNDIIIMSWVWKIGCCFCGCSEEEESLTAKPKRRSGYQVIVDQEPIIKSFPSKFDLQVRSPRRRPSLADDSSSISCSGYQTFACTSDSGSQSDDEGSVDLRPQKKKLPPVVEEEPCSDEMNQVCL